MEDRQLMIWLAFAGCSPDLAALHHPETSLCEFDRIATTDDFKKFSDNLQTQFIDNMELRLMGDLYQCSQALHEIGPTDKNYPRIQKNYIDTLKVCTPIVERLSAHSIEINAFDGLKISIDEDDGTDDEQG